MAVVTKKIDLNTKGDTDIINITLQVGKLVKECPLTKGTVTVFLPGSTGGLTTIEYEPGALQDLKRLFEKITSQKDEYAHNTKWGDMNGYAHVRSSLLGTSLTIPFIDKTLQLGTWQQIIFLDFDNRPRSREIILQIIGE